MNDIIPQSRQLPDTLEDLTKFVLIGREKLVSVRAEIKAIDKIGLAKEVRDQKKSEAQMLSEALLDAEVRIGELLKAIPKMTGKYKRSDEDLKFPTAGKSSNESWSFRSAAKSPETTLNNSEVPLPTAEEKQKGKMDIIKDLGFSKNQVNHLETLANNKDLVEYVKQEARENDDIPTRTRVIDLAQQRKRQEEEKTAPVDTFDYDGYIDRCYKTEKDIRSRAEAIGKIEITTQTFSELKEAVDTRIAYDLISNSVERAYTKILRIKKLLERVKEENKNASDWNKY